jgi:phospholipid transport system transporter-binding protein
LNALATPTAGFALPAAVTLEDVGEIAARALVALHGCDGAWVVDAAALRAFDSSCLALLLELQRAGGARALQVRGAPPRLRQLAGAYGLDFIFDVTG